MRISIVTSPFIPVPPAPCGAVERVWHHLGEEFTRQGHEVTLLSRSWPQQPGRESLGRMVIVRKSGFARTGRLSLDLAKDGLYSLRMLPVLPRADIVVTNVFWLPALLPWLRRGAGRVVINVQRMPKRQMWIYRGAARLAAVSQAVGDAILEQCPAAEPRVRVIPNPISTDVFVPPASRCYEGLRTILFTGRVHPEKGLHLLVEAFVRLSRQVPGLRLRLVGPTRVQQGGGGEDYVAQLRQLAQGAAVEFVPPIAEEAGLLREMHAAHYYCYPSLAGQGEALPVAPLEAMATGLAPIVSDLACFRDVIRDGQSGLVFNHQSADPAGALLAVLQRAMASPAQMQALGQAAAARAQDLSYQRVAQRYLSDFAELSGLPRK